jgi:uncharacterized membrane protein YqaE (UPF0057 family)
MLYFLCFLPPLAILFCGVKPFTLIVNIILTLCGYVPGVIHAFFVVSAAKADKRTKKITKEIAKQTNEMKKANKIAENLAEQQVVANEANRNNN